MASKFPSRWVVCASVASVALAAYAGDARGQPARPPLAPPVVHVQPIVLDEVYAHPLARDCVYRSRVRGVIVEHASPDGAADYRLGYAPDLRVRSTVRCADRPASLEWERRVRFRNLTPERLAAEVGRRTRIVTAATGRECTFARRFAFNGRGFTETWVAQHCVYPPHEGESVTSATHPARASHRRHAARARASRSAQR